MKKILLMGNPNVGKSALFSRLTGIHVIASNYPGTTVEFTQGTMGVKAEKAILIDVEVNRFRSNEKWVPRSVIEDGDCYNNYSGDTDFYVQSWFVKKEGLIEEVY